MKSLSNNVDEYGEKILQDFHQQMIDDILQSSSPSHFHRSSFDRFHIQIFSFVDHHRLCSKETNDDHPIEHLLSIEHQH